MKTTHIKFGDALTAREVEVLRAMADGLSNRAIGERLFIAENSVKTHARRLFRKLGARDRCDAVRLGLDGGVLDPQQTKKRVRAVLDAHRAARGDAPTDDCLYAQLFDGVEAALADPPH